MLSPKRVIEIASKWQYTASLKRRNMRRICLSSTIGCSSSSSSDHHHHQKCKVHQVAQKGHFVVYSIDKKRFMVPLHCLNHNIFKELFKMSEEEFGLPSSGPIIFPCDAVFMEYVIYLVKQHDSEEHSSSLFFITMLAYRCSFNILNHQRSQQLLLPSF